MYDRLNDLKLSTKVILVFLGLTIMIIGGLYTEFQFKKVKYPDQEMGGVPLTFDLSKKIQDFEIIRANHKLEQLKIVQYYDLGIIVGTLLFFCFLTILINHRLRLHKTWKRIGIVTFSVFIIAPTTDLLENISLIILLNNFELTIANLVNSLFTLGKIASFFTGWFLLLILLVFNMTDFLKKKLYLKKS